MDNIFQNPIVKRFRDRVVQKNLERMLSMSDGGMASLLLGESMGGNAGTYKGLPCMAANFVYNTFTGEILYFANSQEIPSNIRGHQAIFRLALNFKNNSQKIINCYGIDEQSGKFRKADYASEPIKEILKETAEAYNQAVSKRNSA